MEEESKQFTQILIGIVTHLTSLSPSMCLSFSAIIVPILTSSDSLYHITIVQASWVAIVVTVTLPIGCISGWLSDKYGRKTMLIASNIVAFLGWLIIYVAYWIPSLQYMLLIIGRLTTGLSAGMVLTMPVIYITEVSTPSTRSMFTTWNATAFTLGNVLVFSLGSYFGESWGKVVIIAMVLPILSAILTMIYLPESPLWLISQNRLEEADRCWKLLGQQRSDEENAKRLRLVETANLQPSSFTPLYQRLLKPTCWKPMIIVLAYLAFLQFSGVFVLVAYAFSLAQELQIYLNSYWIFCIIAVTRLIGSLVLGVISKNFGRRPLSLVSGVGMSVCMLGMSFYLFIISNNEKDSSFLVRVSVLLLLVVYFFISVIGFSTIPYSMSSELFPLDVRGFACGFVTFIACILNFINVNIYFTLITWLGSCSMLLFLYGLVTALGTTFVYLYLPETKGKTLEDIEKLFIKPTSSQTSCNSA